MRFPDVDGYMSSSDRPPDSYAVKTDAALEEDRTLNCTDRRSIDANLIPVIVCAVSVVTMFDGVPEPFVHQPNTDVLPTVQSTLPTVLSRADGRLMV